METKMCSQCKRELPKSAEFFHRNGKNLFKSVCKECRSIRKDKSKPMKSVVKVKGDTKQCSGCLRFLPITSKYFWKDKTGTLGFHAKCRECHGSTFKEKLIAKDGHKYCTMCEKEFPLSTEHFYFHGGSPSSKCKSCELIKQKEYVERNREKVLEQKRIYRNKPENKARTKKYLEDNKERIAEVAKIYHKKNETRIKELHQIYVEEHKEELKAKRKIYMRSERGKEIFRVCNQKRRALKRNAFPTLSRSDWKECLEFFDYKDAYTGLPMEVISQDHVIPLSKGGIHSKRNVVPCDNRINSSKQNDDLEEWYRKQEFFCEERLSKIYKWIGFNSKTKIQQIALF